MTTIPSPGVSTSLSCVLFSFPIANNNNSMSCVVFSMVYINWGKCDVNKNALAVFFCNSLSKPSLWVAIVSGLVALATNSRRSTYLSIDSCLWVNINRRMPVKNGKFKFDVIDDVRHIDTRVICAQIFAFIDVCYHKQLPVDSLK